MQIEFVLRGGSPLLCHNPQMVDPNFEVNREIKKLTKKKTKTDDDNREIEKLEWIGGIYTGTIGGRSVVTQPSSKVRKCLVNAARITKQGKSIERAIIMSDLNVPLIYEGCDRVTDISKELERLRDDPTFVSRLSVGIGNKRVMRVRPQFPRWALIVPALFITDAGLNFEELSAIFTLAGKSERIGDNRVNGYGSFEGVVRCVDGNKSKPITPTLDGVEAFFNQLEKASAA